MPDDYNGVLVETQDEWAGRDRMPHQTQRESDLENIIRRLVRGINWVEEHPTVLVDTDLLVAVNGAPGCEGCYNDALEIVSMLGEKT